MKNQSIKPIKKYEVGGASEDACMEEYVAADGKKRKRRKSGCGYAKSQRVNARRRFWNSDTGKTIKKVGAGVAAAGAGAVGYAKNVFGVKDKVKELTGQKTGGSVKKKMQMGGTTKKYQAGGGASIVAAMKKGGVTKKKK